MTELFQQEKTMDVSKETLDTQNLMALKEQLREVMQQSGRLLICLEKIEAQSKSNKRRYHEAKVISLFHNS